MQKRVSKTFGLLIMLHFVFVIIGAFNIELFKGTKLKEATDIYSNFSGASVDYTYFSQDIPSEVRIRVEYAFFNGNKISESLGENYSREIQLIQDKFMQKFHFSKYLLPEHYARQEDRINFLGHTLISKYKDVKSVTLYFDSFDPVTIENFRVGKRSKWINIASRSVVYDK